MLKRAGGLFAVVCAAVLFCADQATLHAQGIPPNDDLTNSIGIDGSSGSIYGTNINATGEANEPSPFSTNHASIWYMWTAPYTTTMDFNTRGSVVPEGPNAGNDLDTLLAVYTISANTNLAFSNLTLVATNDDDPSGGVVSRVDFPVTVGHVYLIQVDGSTNNATDGQPLGSNAVGWTELNWSPSLVGGSFGFSSTLYLAGDLDDIMPIDFGGNPMDASLANKSGTNNIRITVSRTGGNTGRCEVTLVVTNVTFTNVFETNYVGTNIFITNYDANSNVLSWTNAYSTNIASENFFESYVNTGTEGSPFGNFVYDYTIHDQIVTQTNFRILPNAPLINRPVTNNLPLSGFGLTNFFTNFIGFNQYITNYATNTSTTSTNITVTVTQLFSSFFATNFTTPAASNGVDYVALTTNLIFNDFQMSKDFYVQINPSNITGDQYGGIGQDGPDWPDANGNYTYYGANGLLQLVLSNAMLDSNEDPDIIPPTLSANTNALLEIENLNGQPNNYLGSLAYYNTNTAPGTFCTINLERATFRINKGSATAYLYVLVSGFPPGTGSYTMHYTLDCVGLSSSTIGTPNNAFDNNEFDLSAASDYAQPGAVPGDASRGVEDGADFEVPLNLPNDPSGLGIGRNTVWPGGTPYIGSFTIAVPTEPAVAEIAIPIDNNGAVEFDMDVLVNLFQTVSDAQNNLISQSPPGFLGNVCSANMTINFAGTEAGGANDVSFDPDGTAGSYQPDNPVPGANGGPVKAIAVQPNGQSIIGGQFTSYNTTPVYGIARLTTNGYYDSTFNAGPALPGLNYSGYVNAIVIDSQGRIVIGGQFLSYDGSNAVDIARLTSSGALDATFVTGVGFGTNGYVDCLAIDANGDILVGGNFSTYNTTNCNNIARLTPTGGLDTNFFPNTGNGAGTDGEVTTVATDGNGNVILGGDFGHVNGSNLVYLARLLPSGVVDTSFNPEVGPDGEVESVAIAANNEIVIGGDFQNYNLVSRSGLALVNVNGALDTTFVPGTGADGPINSVIIQPADGKIVAGGQFRNFNGSRRLGVVRCYPNGWVDPAFMDTAYNQYAGLINTYYNESIDPVHICYSLALQPDGNIMVGGSFTNVGGGSARDDIHSKINVARLIGLSNPGPQTGGSGIGNNPGNITLTENPYTIDDTAGSLFVVLDRVNGSLGAAELTLGTNTSPPGPGEATAADYGLQLPALSLYDEVHNHWITYPTGNYDWRKCDGYWGDNNAIQPLSDFGASVVHLNIYDDKTALQNLYAGISELNLNAQDLLKLGGVSIPMYPSYGLPSSPLEIINDNIVPGIIGFSATNYIAINTSNTVTVTVLRTNGTQNPITVEYGTANGTAISNFYYTGEFPGSKTTLTFPGGNGSSANTETFTVPILPQSGVANTKTFKLFLTNSNPEGVFDTNIPPLLSTTSTVTIIDGNFTNGHLSFTSPTYGALKGGTATIGVQRLGGAVGQLTVQCGTSNGTAVNGINYTGVTNTLTWGDKDVSVKTMQVPTLQDNTVDGTLTVNLSLFNATVVGGPPVNNSLILNTPSNAVLSINDVDSYGQLHFTAQNYNVMQTAGQALITVTRGQGDTGAISVNYQTVTDTNPPPGEQSAVAGTNYGTTNGLLVFASGQTSASFYVQVYNTSTGESSAANRILYLELYNGQPNGLTNQNQFPVLATLTILDPNLIVNQAGSIDETTENGTGFNNTVNSLTLQPDGSILAGGAFTFVNQYPFNYVSRLQPGGDFDENFLYNQAGPNGTVYQVVSQVTNVLQTNIGSIVVAGGFSQVDNASRPGIARMNLEGSIDETFSPGSGADNTIYALAETFLPSGASNFTLAYYIGGAFANFDGTPSGGIARLNASTNSPGPQGAVDPNFIIGQGATGENPIVRALAVQADGKVVLGGDFTSWNNLPYNHIIRLNVDGSIDTNFAAGSTNGTSDSVRTICIQPDGQILIGGLFTNVAGVNMNYIARLNGADGSLDTNFNLGTGATNGGNNAVLALTVDDQERILVGGQFSEFNGVTRYGITRLNPDGTVDPTINFQAGAGDGYIDTIVIQTNDEIDLGGGFSTFEGQAENNFVRVYGGATAGEGSIQFSQSAYGVLENATNAVITLQRFGGEGTPGSEADVSVVFSTADGPPPDGATNGVDYIAVTTNVTFKFGETFETVTIPILNSNVVAADKTLYLNLSSPTYASIGTLATATLTITNVNSYVSYAQAIYNQSADAPGGNALIPITRYGFTNSTVSVTAYTGTNGTATPYTNYMPETNVITFNPGVVTTNFLVPVLNASNMFSDQTVDLELSNGVNTLIAGSNTSATLYIDNVYNGPGVLAFSQSNYSILAPTSIPATNAIITLIRTNGSSNSVWVTLTTSNGTATAGTSSNGYAVNGTNYQSVTTTVYFADGETNETVPIPIYAQPQAGPATTVYLNLSNPGNGATIGGPGSQVVLTILNAVENIAFTNSPYFVNESAGTMYVDAVRNGNTNLTASATYYTYTPTNTSESQGWAQPYIDYTPVSNTVTFAPGVTFQELPIQILQTNMVNLEPLTFYVDLESNLDSGDQIQMPGGQATVEILCDVTGFEFATNTDGYSTNLNSYFVGENGSNIVISVYRINPDTGEASVQFATADNTALSNIDYLGTNGTLFFPNGVASNSFTVPILNPNLVENNKSFNVLLSNPQVLTLPNPSTNAYLLSPSNVAVTITNVLAGVSFASSSYSVSECSNAASIAVILSGVTNIPVTVNFSTTNGGSGAPGTNYFITNGTLTFAPGQTVQTFNVVPINDGVIGPDHTVYLELSDAQGAQLLNPSTAVLTIQECNGHYIVKSGTAFVSGNMSPPGDILPGETVTIDFGLRAVAGGDTTDLIATLLATNGITNVSGPQTYGVLVTNGPTVYRPFTFTAEGTNGQTIVANFTLTDGASTNVNPVAFGFTLGGGLITVTTNEALYLYGSNNPPTAAYNNNPPNYGYPSVLNISGAVGNMTSVSIVLSNFSHSFPADVSALLDFVPSGGTNLDTYLFADCGGSTSVNDINLTFASGVSNSLPSTSALTSGTYSPTTYDSPSFPANTNLSKPQVPPKPYPTSLASFIGQSPNGTWLLFMADDNQFDSGELADGWSISIGTGISVEEDADLETGMTASVGSATMLVPLTYTITVTNYGPAGATNVTIVDTLPQGVYYGTNLVGAGGLNITNNVGTLAVGGVATWQVVITPNTNAQAYYITNAAVATANQPDLNVNNAQTNVLFVESPSADLAVALTSGPGTVADSNNVVYTNVVINNGPSTATGVLATNVLPEDFVPINISPLPESISPTTNADGTVTVTVVWNIGTLANAASATLTLAAEAELPTTNTFPVQTNTDLLAAGSQVYDPTKTNNFAFANTVVNPPPPAPLLSLSSSGSSYTLSWPTGQNLVLKGAVSLGSPWVTIPNASNPYVLTSTNIYHFFIVAPPP